MLSLAQAELASPAMHGAESLVIAAVHWLRLVAEVIGAAVVGVGVLVATAGMMRRSGGSGVRRFVDVRLTLAGYLVVGLEFQLAADILSTAVAPSWDAIGRLGAIAVIRTALNYFLLREVHAEARLGGGA